MKLQELNLDVAGVVGAPVSITAPEPVWLAGRESGVVPEALFGLYEQAGYLSFGSAPNFLSDAQNILFSYFGMLVRGLRQQLQESVDLVVVLKEAHDQLYTPIKKAKGIPWDRTADQRANRAFRDLLAAAYGSLDILAELVALVFTNRIPGLKVGRAQFGTIEAWLRKTTEAPDTPPDVLAEPLTQLRKRLSLQVLSEGPEREWLPFLRLLRNKSAHLGDDVFRYFGLFDSTGALFFFVPREWPYFFQMHMKPAGESGNKEPFPDFLKRTLVHQDYISFAEGLNLKIRTIVAESAVACQAALQVVGASESNQEALAQLKTNSRAHEFECFQGA